MADQPLTSGDVPQFTDAEYDLPRTPIIKGVPRAESTSDAGDRTERKRGVLALIDRYVVVVVALLLAIGSMMVYSSTFDWSYQEFGSATYIFSQHLRNLGIGVVAFAFMMLIDYRLWKRFAVIMLLVTVGGLIAVLLFGDGTFGARRAFFQGSYQPGELAELVVVIYMAAWLGSKRTKVQSLTFGLIPFMVLLGIIGGLVILQPDISTAATIFVVSGLMFFLAGANIWHLAGVLGLMGAGGVVLTQQLSYAADRLSSYTAGLADLTQTNYHTQQVIIAFLNGWDAGIFGRGLGQGLQKFGFLPAPHTDSIFAVIGEELGVAGAVFVVALYAILIIRGLTIARRATDIFGGLLAAGVTLWIATKALLNIAVMLNLVPSTGVALPFLSFGGSSLVVVMAGAGLLLSVSRLTAQQNLPEGRGVSANYDRGWGNRWSRLSSPRSR